MTHLKPLLFSFAAFLLLTTSVPSLRSRVAGAGSDVPPGCAPRQTRRALLVGINRYNRNDDFENLRGPRNDVRALGELLADKKYGFQVQTLPEEQATHDGIIAAFRKYLITDAGEGDVCLFFFSGHGTQIRNSSSTEHDKLDEALVPIDVKRPVTAKKDVREIRDKELTRLYNDALSKGVKLIVLIDSCHSGSTARGLDSARVKRIDALLTVDMAEPPDPAALVDPRNKDAKSPEERGALVMAASLDNESAMEHSDDAGVDYSDFSKALIYAMRTSDANRISAQQLFFNVSSRLRQEGRTQHPTLGNTTEGRRQLTLLGDQAAADSGQTEVTVVVDQPNETLELQNGADIGLTRGSEFRRKGDPTVRIRISEEVKELGRAKAEPISPTKLEDLKTGDVFEQDKWASDGKPRLKVWLPPARLSASQIQTIATELSKLRSSEKVQWIDDPTEEIATHVLSFEEDAWQMAAPNGTVTKLVGQPTAEGVLKLLSTSGLSRPKLFVYFPLPTEFRNKIKLGEGTQKSAVAVAGSRGEALYLLVGRLSSKTPTTLEYAWVLPAATQGDSLNDNDKALPESLPLPPLTNWIELSSASASQDPAAELETVALRLCKIKGWLSLTSPPQDKGHGFPYRLIIKNANSNAEIHNGGELTECEIYQIELAADEAALSPLPRPRYVYVLGMDKYGTSSLLHGAGNDGNKWPTKLDLSSGKATPHIPLDDATFIVIGPTGRCIDPTNGKLYGKGLLGFETYIMLSTEEPLPLPELLDFKGVRTPADFEAEMARKGSRGRSTDLQDLLSGIGATVRSPPGTTSLNWSVQQLTFRSVEKKP